MTQSEFSVGDRVTVTHNIDSVYSTKDKSGILVASTPNSMHDFVIVFDGQNITDLYQCSIDPTNLHSMWFSDNYLEDYFIRSPRASGKLILKGGCSGLRVNSKLGLIHELIPYDPKQQSKYEDEDDI